MGHHRRTAAVLTATLAATLAAALSAAAPVHARTQLDTRATSAALPAAAAAELAVPQRYRAQDLHWQVCDEATGTECAFMTVPRDWHSPGARVDLSIAVSRTQPPDGTATRYVFGNPGGPGGPGLGMAPFLASQPGLGDHIGVGFDVRGTGLSTSVSCQGAPQYTMDPRDRDRATRTLVRQVSQMYDSYCTLMSRGLRDYVTTEQTVRDMDLLRQLLGAQTIDYVGYSGGTWLGAYYQEYFPQRVGRFVLDSNTDFTRPWNVTFEAQPQSFERRFRQDFLPWAARYDAVLQLGTTATAVHRYYESLRADLKAKPVAIVLIPGQLEVSIDQNTLDQVTAQSLYSKVSFQELAGAYRELRGIWDAQAHGGAAAAQNRFEALAPTTAQALRTVLSRARDHASWRTLSPDGSSATFLAITCNDTAWPRGQAYLDRLADTLGPRYPLVGWSANQNPCAYWTRPSLTLRRPDGVGLPPTLMIQSVHDPATNARLATDAHARYAGSVLLTVTREGDHGIYGGVNACVDRITDRFLRTGRAPEADLTCQGTGIPAPVTDPGGRAAAQRSPLDRVAELSDRISRSFG